MKKEFLVIPAILVIALAFQNCGKVDNSAPTSSADGSSSGALFPGGTAAGTNNNAPPSGGSSNPAIPAQVSIRFAGVDNINWNNVQIVRITIAANTTTYNQLNGPLSNNFFLLPGSGDNQRLFGHIEYLDGAVTRVYEGEMRANLNGNVSLMIAVALVP